MRWIGPLEAYERIITENPIEEIWHLIDFFTAEETISKCNPPVDKELIPFICESIAQAEEFRRSAATSGEHTRPLLTYYSMHNLTKAVLALETNKKPIGYHGLMKVELPKNEDFLGTSVQINDGVFSELLSINKIEPIRNLKITADDLMRRCGYLMREYRFAYEREPSVIVPQLDAEIRLNELELTLRKTNEINDQKLTTIFPRLMNYFELIKTEADVLSFRLKDSNPKRDLAGIQTVIKDTLSLSVFSHPPYFLVPCTDPRINWPQEAYLYALSFILGSLVRYYPDYWYKNVIANKRNRWIVRKTDSIVERVYPNLMVNIMFGYKFYKFSPLGI
jgi:hypothetical protein